ncbi:hypothetical protein HYPSUDRAFT_209191 [Hypholoma sublateritium FD-334 SS-4]|uniref:Uncharacterized protein n=1 Tax=Hypholoma sublateritium (strain FD-334 SS-4) TaxID=945553 RepID=A0A0D2N3M7_HYPSF|nr:hypothetical protein HYPSUDRAFT_209191 [Hypholoma sublateritium FD-334 SS-4]
MFDTRYKRQKLLNTGRVYRDRIPLEEDFEVIRVRTASRSGPNKTTIETGRISIPSPWTVGCSWAPEDDPEFSLDPDDEWYNEALEADIVDTEDTDVVIPKKKKKRSQLSWRHLKALKRAGRGHDSTRADGTSDGELAIACPSCPHPGINLPSGWADAPAEKQFLYMKHICMDANFRLKNNLVSNLSADPGLWNNVYRRRLKVFAEEQEPIPKSLRTSALQDQRNLLTEKIKNWESVRLIYMPGVLQIQTDLKLNPTALWNTSPNPEDVELWLPSRIPTQLRRAACVEGLPEMELKLRTAQVHKRAIRFVQKYRAARRAKLTLEGTGTWERVYQELQNEDIRGYASGKVKKQPLRRGIWEDGQAPVDAQSTEVSDSEDGTEVEDSDPDLNDGTESGPVRYKKRKKGTGETRKGLSWIWQNAPLSENDKIGDNEILQAEWARSRARVRRCKEEVLLLQEEMRRVLEFLEYKAVQWEIRTEAREGMEPEAMEGIRAYATEQAVLQRKLASSFKSMWMTPLASVDTLLEKIDNTPGDNKDEDDDEGTGSDDEPDNAGE